jgi:2-(1,2-epoxy-1,2-dihydrophenyl)acetyl-CoA isomerase
MEKHNSAPSVNAKEDEVEEEVLLETREGGVLILTLNRPDALNALNARLMNTLPGVLARAAEDREVSCVVLTGAGRGFCSGGDLGSINKAADARAATPVVVDPDSVERRIQWVRRTGEAARLLHEMEKPTIAMINGACAGAGLCLAGACDLRIAAESAVFVSAFTKFGIPGDYGGAYFWTRILGTAKARELYLLGERMDAAKALEFGLLTRVVPDADLRAATMEIAQTFAGRSRVAYGYAKRNLNAAETQSLSDVLSLEATNTILAREAGARAKAARKAAEGQGQPA